MTRYEELDHNIEECAYEGQSSSEEWDTIVLDIAAEAFDNFTDNDWEQLLRELPGKPVMWKDRFCDLIDDHGGHWKAAESTI